MPEAPASVPTTSYGVDWHYNRLIVREERRVGMVGQLIVLAEELASRYRMETLAQQKIISALYLPTVQETTLALAELLAELNPKG